MRNKGIENVLETSEESGAKPHNESKNSALFESSAIQQGPVQGPVKATVQC
jgi:hypothetical protein